MEKLGVVVCFLLCASACSGSSETTETTVTMAPTTTVVASTTTTTVPPTTTTTTVTPTTSVTPTTTVVASTATMTVPPTTTTTTVTPTTSVAQTTSVAPTTTLKPLEIWQEVYQSIGARYDQLLDFEPGIEIISSPTVADAIKNAALESYSAALRFGSEIFEVTEPMTLVLMTGEDKEWYTEYAKEVEGKYFESYYFDQRFKSGIWSGGPKRSADGSWKMTIVIGADAEHWNNAEAVEDPLSIWQREQHAIHEVTHFFQNMAAETGVEECRPENDWSDTGMLPLSQRVCQRFHSPCWFREGQASIRERAFGYGKDPDFVEGLRQTRLDHIKRPYPDVASFGSSDWLKLLRYLQPVPVCSGDASSPVIHYSMGIAVMEIMSYEFGESKIHEWMGRASKFPSDLKCPSWVPAFEEIFGISSDKWLQDSAVPYLIDVFGDSGAIFDESESFIPPPSPFCSNLQPPSGEEWPTVKGIPTGPHPAIGCDPFDSRTEAQIWFDYFFESYGDIGGLDANLDGIACGSNLGERISRIDIDWYGVWECSDGKFWPAGYQYCYSQDSLGGDSGADASSSGCPSGQEKTVGLCNEIMHTCGSFNSQGDAQTWFEANPDFGENIDTNRDGIACGEDDYGGETTCSSGERALPQFCAEYLGNS